MSEMWDFVPKSLERPKSYGMGTGREGVLMEVFVLTERGDLVGAFSTREKLTEHIVLCPATFDFQQHPLCSVVANPLGSIEPVGRLLDTVLTDA